MCRSFIVCDGKSIGAWKIVKSPEKMLEPLEVPSS
jgi:hypothetical protein